MLKTANTITDAQEFGLQAASNMPLSLAVIFNTMRILKKQNPGDAYYENYLHMAFNKYGPEEFFDTYQVLWAIGVYRKPKRILEIGCRTGISLCQLLSSYVYQGDGDIEKVVCVDPFDQWTSPNLVRKNLAALNINLGDRLKILAMKSEDYFSVGKGETFDYILVDGDHTKTVAAVDLQAAHNVLESGGIIVFDDISTAEGECGLIDVWEAFENAHFSEYTFAKRLEGKGVAWAIKV